MSKIVIQPNPIINPISWSIHILNKPEDPQTHPFKPISSVMLELINWDMKSQSLSQMPKHFINMSMSLLLQFCLMEAFFFLQVNLMGLKRLILSVLRVAVQVNLNHTATINITNICIWSIQLYKGENIGGSSGLHWSHHNCLWVKKSRG